MPPCYLPIRPPPAQVRVEDHLGLVHALAGRAHRDLGRSLERDDLVSAGMSGLLEAAQRYRGGGAAFSTFAHYRVRGAIYDRVRAACSERGAPRTRPAPKNAASARDRRRTDRPEEVRAPEPGPEDTLAARELLALLARALSRLSSRERALVRRSFLDGVPLAVVAADLGLSESRASRVRRRALVRLRRDLERALAHPRQSGGGPGLMRAPGGATMPAR